jgi:hypothetical protein
MDVAALRQYDELFQTQGWKNLLREAEDELDLLKEQLFHNAKTMEEVCALRGQAFQLNKLITLEDVLIAMVQAEQGDDDADL